MQIKLFGEDHQLRDRDVRTMIEALLRVVTKPDEIALAAAQDAIDQAGLDELQATMVAQEVEA